MLFRSLEPLEPLRLLFSYQQVLAKQKPVKNDNDNDTQQKSLEKYEKAINNTWDRLYGFLRQEQKSTAKQIDALDGEIARLNLALRVGESSLSLYLSQIDDLRRSRESLERYNHNLIAWQETEEPLIAGDIARVSLESFDEESFEIYIPESKSFDTEKPLYLVYGQELKGLFEVRTALERRLSEWQRMVAENEFSTGLVQDGLAETEAALSRNMACIRFCQQRIGQIITDCDNDLKALSKYKADVVERAEKKQLQNDNLQQMRNEIEDAEESILRTRSLARQALSANSPMEVPASSSTAMQRMRGTIQNNFYSLDSSFFLVAAFLTILGLLMFTDNVSSGTDWLAVLSTCVAVGIATLGVILERNARTPIITFLWLLLLVLVVIFVYQRTAMDKYLIFWSQINGISIPVPNVRGWFVVLGATFAGAGAGVALANYTRQTKASFLNVPLVIALCTIMSGVAVAASHTIAPRTTPLDIEKPENDSAIKPVYYENSESVAGTMEASTVSSETAEENSTSEDGPDENSDSYIDAENTPLFRMQGVVHSEGISPLFKATISYPDGTVDDVSLQLGDAIIGDWVAKEYNKYSRKLTISNGERLLILEAGRQVPLVQSAEKAS